MAINIQSAANIQTPYTAWYFWGALGSGKTRAACTFPRPLLIVPTQENSHVTVMGRADVSFMVVKDSLEVSELVDHLEACAAKAAPFFKKGDADSMARGDELYPYETVVMESVTHYCDALQEELTKGSKVDMDRTKWGKLGAHLRHIHTRLRALPSHLVYCALSRDVKDKEGTFLYYEPAVPGQMGFKLPSACDGFVYFDVVAGNPQDSYFAYFTKQTHANARVRFDVLRKKRKVQNFDFSEVQKVLGWV